MPYATLQDMIDRFGQRELVELSDHDNTGAIDANVVQRALGDASSEIDGYLAAFYTLPLASVPERLKLLAVDMARYYLFGDRVTTAVETRYKNAVDFLKSVAAGRASLGLDSASAPVVETGGPRVSTPGRIFTKDSLGDY